MRERGSLNAEDVQLLKGTSEAEAVMNFREAVAALSQELNGFTNAFFSTKYRCLSLT